MKTLKTLFILTALCSPLSSCAGITAGALFPLVAVPIQWYPRHGVDPVPSTQPRENSSTDVESSDDYGYSQGQGGYYPGRDRNQSRDSEGGNGRYKVDYDRGTKHGDHGTYRGNH